MSNQSHSISDNEIKAIINNQLNANHLETLLTIIKKILSLNY